ncbi:DUF1919 domain-containing protein [Escherichia coli]
MLVDKILHKTGLFDFLDKILITRPFAIVSNNCWGYRLYKNIGLEYNTPFIGLYITASDFVEMCINLEHFLSRDIVESDFINTEHNFPVAFVDGVKIYFMHYNSRAEAMDKWNRRIKRLQSFISSHGLDRVVFKMCDRDGSYMDVMKFNELKIKRTISFTSKENKGLVESNGNIYPGDALFNFRHRYYLKYIKTFR